MKPSILLLTIGYAVGYGRRHGAFFSGRCGGAAGWRLALIGGHRWWEKGQCYHTCTILNTCTILVSDNSADRTRGMNTMHSCYACGALLCPFSSLPQPG